jgi:hypothetical protein
MCDAMSTPLIVFSGARRDYSVLSTQKKITFLFPSLRIIVDSIGEDTLFEGLDLTSDDWEEMEEYEYAFV